MNYRPGDIDSRRLIKLHKEYISDISSTNYPGVYPDEDNSWDLVDFKKHVKLEFQYVEEERMSLTWIIISEVPTVAIERVYVYDNTSVIQDEVLSHRLGLIPLRIDPRMLEDAPQNYQDDSTDRNTMVFSLDVTCADRDGVRPGTTDPEKLYINSSVYAKDLQWVPQGEQETIFASDPPRAANPNILIAKLRPEQSIHLEMHAVKSIGRDHTKFSPVGTAFYRLMPHIQLLKPGDRYDEESRKVDKLEMADQEQAKRFQDAFSEGVIEVKKERGKYYVRVKAPRRDNVTRRILELREFDGMVRLGRVRDWFIYTIESTGQYPAVDIFPVALGVFKSKIRTLKAEAEKLRREWEGSREERSPDPDKDVEME
ncbi:DNA-directed RNA polymerases I and III subunit RPAC1 {ECO:0000305} Short=RNA polymerases I and III subunit AC1 {ECO:0000305}; AltName: Full=C37; AltName: Full=DNA-directed RNA polymerases I and III 40 kDa polypeptide {ECO:0000303/PubMed:3815519}; Short=AC40 {ECO:0000303/PubMed:3815519}; Short=C40 {ECO:0000305} [Serendipita indica DSM 11827]|nr:DNA-directed RNA polymerases I and III subunit RPAC1 {ECO:0000305} Short=RNA polymerases I and III subunit AC1 {ECO:0000305}; AltName: Full=C37; AltName: Full=DNA-directed RNA polymerases I and III 40 kDa polypeptide {ECO:0000303/PubMed:3815519}; Short=AC40 {ECO:0000303/PubMed:3815519}; Short=C40 {ECO:0000305} [Serendipita indica DSM 11827]